MACTRVKAQKSVANLGRVRMTTMVNNKKKEKNWNHNAARLDIDTARLHGKYLQGHSQVNEVLEGARAQGKGPYCGFLDTASTQSINVAFFHRLHNVLLRHPL